MFRAVFIRVAVLVSRLITHGSFEISLSVVLQPRYQRIDARLIRILGLDDDGEFLVQQTLLRSVQARASRVYFRLLLRVVGWQAYQQLNTLLVAQAIC